MQPIIGYYMLSVFYFNQSKNMALKDKKLQEQFEVQQRRLKHEANLKIGKMFLQITGLKVGDIVNCLFQFDNGRNTFTKEAKGEILQDSDCYLFVQTLEKYPVRWGFKTEYKTAEITDIVSF